VDVLGLGCYVWNWFAQQEIARRVKQANPDCLVVAGGPNCYGSRSDFFRENPYIDVAVRREGEEPLRRILHRRLDGNRSWSDIPGLYVPDAEGNSRSTGDPRLLDEKKLIDESPYQAQSEVFRELTREAGERGETVFGVFETNRGCPYDCSFCDWQQLTNTGVRKYSLGKVRDDIRWIVDNDVDATGPTDANVGMFERDVEISRYLSERARRTGSLKTVHFNPTKSKATHLPEIIENYHEAGLMCRSVISIQHTDRSVLDAISRANLSRSEIRDLIDFNKRNGIPMVFQLILGCPNDTYEKWKKCFGELMAWGADGEYFVSNFHILPNAPAGDEEYIDRWDIDTRLTRNVTAVEVDRDTVLPDISQKQLITSTSTFDERDWIRMWVYSYFVQALHSKGLTQKLAQYFHHVEDVPFERFYSGLVDELAREEGTLFDELRREAVREKEAFLEGRDRLLDRRTELEELPEYGYYFRWEEWMFVRMMLEKSRMYEELADYLARAFSADRTRVDDLLRFQRETMVDYRYDPTAGKRFSGRWDWMEYFDRDRNGLARAPRSRSNVFRVDQTLLDDGETPILWHRRTGRERLKEWIEAVVRDPNGRGDLLTTHSVRRADSSAGRTGTEGVLRSVGRMARDSLRSFFPREPSETL